ncbi:MAG: peptidoglycan DD-metalloendopeptidase family protein [Erysipelotrichaceae bacterium]|nr:peptidoglycan DD-metalloendopeptidase family protein [Erysipelotrichaceae bacterium]
MFRKIVSFILVVFMIVPVSCRTSFVYAEDDDDDDRSDYDRCVIDKDKEACARLTASARENLHDIEDQIAAAQNDRDAARALAIEYASKAESMQAEIDALSVQIENLKIRIAELEVQIEENERKIEALNTRVKNRMAETQKTMHFNGYLEFVLGSKSFTDLLARIYGVEAIVSKDQNDRDELMDIIRQLNADKEELDKSKQQLDESYESIVSRQAELLAMQEFYEEEEARINEELDAMTEARDNIYESFEDLQAILRESGITVNTGFMAAVHNSWITATVWNYTPDFQDGEWHLGVDYAASRGTQIHAPAGGIIIRADAGCADPGILGSSCGAWISGGGNQVYLMCEVDGRVYGFIFFHLNSVYVEYGDLVLQDDVIGTVGSSGSSTGPHCHIEMYYLGKGELLDYLAMGWNATFSVGRGRTAYNNRCYYDDGSYRQNAPCILNPEWYLPEG